MTDIGLITLILNGLICIVSGQKESQPIFKAPLNVIVSKGSDCPWTSIRLPSFIKPLHYEVYLHPNVSTYEFKGKTSLFFKLTQSTKFIVVHGKELNIEEVGIKLKDKSSKKLNDLKVSRVVNCPDSDKELFFIETEQLMSSDPTAIYKLFITYNKQLSEESLEGLYVSKYNVSKGSIDIENKIVSTQFEPISARLAFPCLDEPNLKATFTIKIVHEPKHRVHSNTIVANDQPFLDINKDGLDDKHDERDDNDNYDGKMSKAENLIVSTFEKTVKMSTYLVAIMVSEFMSEEKISKNGHVLHVLAPEDQMPKMKFALDVGSQLVDHFEQFFGIKYPLSKLDLVAIPAFAADAMENWGIVTFAAEAINYDPEDESIFDKERVVITISHELSHQWFGNLVTMSWWEDLWLNEGFATFMSMIGAEALFPEWMTSGQFVSMVNLKAMVGDSSRFTHPIQNQINNPDEIFASFDSITYEKTAALLRHLSLVIGMDNLKSGLRTYMEKYQYGNTMSKDLWNTLSDNGNVNINVDGYEYLIEEVMDNWIKTKGYPLVDVKVNGQDQKVTIRQMVYFQHPTVNVSKMDADKKVDSKWTIKLDFVTSKEPEKVYFKWMTTKQISFKSTELTDSDWFKINFNSNGFYRVNYDSKNWINLIKMMKSNPVLKVADRTGLIDDCLSLMRSGHVKPSMAMQLITYLEHNERDFVPWDTAIKHFDAICSKLKDQCPLFKKFVSKMVRPTINLIGLDDQGSHMNTKLRSILINYAIGLNDETVSNHFKKIFDDWKRSEKSSNEVLQRTKLNPNLKKAILTTGIRHGDQGDYDFVMDKFRVTKSPAEKSPYLKALGQSQSIKSIKMLLQSMVHRTIGSNNHQKNHVTILSSLVNNDVIIGGQIDLWSWFKDNYDNLSKLNSPMDGAPYVESIKLITGSIDTEDGLNDVQRFLKGKESDNTIDTITEVIEGNIYFKQTIKPKIVEWLNVYEKKNKSS